MTSPPNPASDLARRRAASLPVGETGRRESRPASGQSRDPLRARGAEPLPQPQFRYTNVWAENDLLIWDHLGTLHRAIADYAPDEIRLIRRCQVMATKVFDPEFLRPARELAAAEAA